MIVLSEGPTLLGAAAASGLEISTLSLSRALCFGESTGDEAVDEIARAARALMEADEAVYTESEIYSAVVLGAELLAEYGEHGLTGRVEYQPELAEEELREAKELAEGARSDPSKAARAHKILAGKIKHQLIMLGREAKGTNDWGRTLLQSGLKILGGYGGAAAAMAIAGTFGLKYLSIAAAHGIGAIAPVGAAGLFLGASGALVAHHAATSRSDRRAGEKAFHGHEGKKLHLSPDGEKIKDHILKLYAIQKTIPAPKA